MGIRITVVVPYRAPDKHVAWLRYCIAIASRGPTGPSTIPDSAKLWKVLGNWDGSYVMFRVLLFTHSLVSGFAQVF